MRKIAMLTAGLLLGASLLGGCGGNSGGSSSSGYCSLVKSAKDKVNTFSSGSIPTDQQLADFQTQVHNLAAKAPSSLSNDWKVVGDALDSLIEALKSSGIKMSDLVSAMASGQLPPGVDVNAISALGSKLQKLQSTDFKNAAKAIADHAKSDCGVTISLGG